MVREDLERLGKDKVQLLLNESVSIADFLRKIENRDVGGNRKTLYKFIDENNLSLETLKENREKALLKGYFSRNKKNNDDIFIENSKVERSIVKSRILKENLIEYKCEKCGNNGKWKDEELVLHLDHKNGIGNDNRLENLRFLCPNCHSQTKTYSGKNYKSSFFKEHEDAINNKKEQVEQIKKNKKEESKTNKETLTEERRKSLNDVDLTKFGWNKKVSNLWGVSHSQVRRWIEKYYPEIDFFERGK